MQCLYLFFRIEGMMRKMQSRVPFLSEPERNMKRELESMDEKLETYQRNLEQVRIFLSNDFLVHLSHRP